VAAALERAAHEAGPGFSFDLGELTAEPGAVPRTVVVRTQRPIAIVRAIGGLPLAVEAQRSGDPPVGSGPFRIVSWEQGSWVRLRAFADHWRGRPAIDEVEFRAEPDAARRASEVEAGAAHVAIDVPAEQVARLQRSTQARAIVRPGLRVVFLGIRCSPGPARHPFTDVRVRRAVAQAVDRQALVKRALGGLASPADQIVPPGILGYEPLPPGPPHDREAARRVLGEVMQADPARLDYPAGKYRAIDRVAEGVAADLAAAGLPVAPRARPPHEFLTDPDPAAPLWLLGWLTTRDAGLSYDALVHTPRGGLGAYNWMGYSSPEVDRVLDRFRVLFDPREHDGVVSAVARRIADDVPAVPLYQVWDVYGVARELEFEPRLDRRLVAAELAWR
jgi:peptide/nickel transport system substrate-binding protein